MKLFIPIIALFQLLMIQAMAQSPDWLWAKRVGSIGDDFCGSVTVDSLGNYYCTGAFRGTVDFDPGPGIYSLSATGNADLFIYKIDGSGNFIWAKSIGGVLEDEGYSIIIDSASNVFVTGSFEGTVDFDPGPGINNLTGGGMFITKLDSNGNSVWAKGMSPSIIGLSIALDDSGNVYSTGQFMGTADFDPGIGTFMMTSSGDRDIFISKLNRLGNLVWARQIGGPGFDRSTSIVLNGSAHIYTTGTFTGTVDFDPGAGINNLTSSVSSIFVSKLDSSGNFIWAKAFGGSNGDAGLSLATDPNGNGDLYVSGCFEGTADFDPGVGIFNLSSVGGIDACIFKLDDSGNFVWAKSFGGTSWERAYGIAIDNRGGQDVYATGYFVDTVDMDPGPGVFNLASGNVAVFVSKFDSAGDFSWAKGVGGGIGQSISFNQPGKICITGYFVGPSISFGTTTLTNAGTGSSSDAFMALLDTTIISGSPDIFKPQYDVFIVPNPVNNQLIVIDKNLTGIRTVTIYNLLGEKLLEKTSRFNNREEKIDVSQLASGLYVVVVSTENLTVTLKMLKE